MASTRLNRGKLVKDGAYYCYFAYVLRISRYSGFLWVVPTNTGIFLRGLKLYGETVLSKCFWYLIRKLGVTMHFSEIIKLRFRKKSHTLLYILAVFRDIIAQLSLKNAWLPWVCLYFIRNFSLIFQVVHAWN